MQMQEILLRSHIQGHFTEMVNYNIELPFNLSFVLNKMLLYYFKFTKIDIEL